MIEKIVNEIEKKYNLEINVKQKLPKVFNISFKLEGKEISFVYMYDSMKSFDGNMNVLEQKVNTEIIDYYRKKVKNSY